MNFVGKEVACLYIHLDSSCTCKAHLVYLGFAMPLHFLLVLYGSCVD